MIVELLESNNIGSSPVTMTQLKAWVDTYKIPVTTVMDPPPDTGLTSYKVLGQRETTYIVDLRTMKIVKRILGDVTGAFTPGLDSGITQIIALLKA